MIDLAKRLLWGFLNATWPAVVIFVAVASAILPFLILMWSYGWAIGEQESELAVATAVLGNVTGFVALYGMCHLTFVLFGPKKERNPND